MITKYNINLDVDFKGLSYTGLETISGEFVNGIDLDFDGLNIMKVFGGTNNLQYEIKEGKLKIGKTSLNEITIEFGGRISEKSLMGIHKSTYGDGYIVTTQMEPTGARSVFPCVDNPSAKANFNLEIKVNDDVEVISNTSPLKAERGERSSHFIFKETPKMSTYLIYIGIGKFERIKKNHHGKELSVVTTPGKSEQGRYALDLLAKIMDEYEEYYEIKYPLDKMDLIAVPQFGAGAMENWGAITFREFALLVNESTSLSFKKEVGKTLSHEMAHQWFGNLVTMEWWDDLWLNESFATFVGNKILGRIENGWKVWEEFLSESTLPSMKKDSLLSTHPIRVKVNEPSQIAEIFDSISYGKGASILRMIEDFMGEDNFRKGVIKYLKDHAYSNAKAEDLWNSLAETSEYDIVKIMKTWLEKGGLPYLTIEKKNGKMIARQKKFTLLDNNDDFLWEIPLVVSTGEGKKKLLLNEETLSLPSTGNLLINPNGTGYFRVLYSKEVEDELLNSLTTPEHETRLIDDFYAFLQAGKIDLADFMKALESIRRSDEYSVIFRTVDILENSNEIIEDARLRNFIQEYATEKLEVVKKSKDENSLVLKEKLFNLLAEVDESFRRRNSPRVKDYGAVSPEEKSAVLISAAKEGCCVDKINELIENPTNDLDQIRAMVGMSQLRNGQELKEFLSNSLLRNELRGNLLYSLIYSTRNKEFRRYIWDWMDENIESVYGIYKGSGSISFLIEDLIAIAGIGNALRVQEFISKVDIPEGKRAMNNGLERLEINERLIKRVSG
ncbi:MAG: M1 family metallopeptidase [Candidatus Thermoplasmatota archaeon]|jgi:tricorn protease interacting factor F2/3|nr:M1 family metallopeptidase [Candidatus Thermoplasmatota archaeon]MCL5680415.1 M1 family metallopeptidase [Candidatus Thermoplasmatota archaeon]